MNYHNPYTNPLAVALLGEAVATAASQHEQRLAERQAKIEAIKDMPAAESLFLYLTIMARCDSRFYQYWLKAEH